MNDAPPIDPRSARTAAGERDIRPIVDKPRGGLSNLALIGIALVVAIILFGVLNARRQASSAPAVQDIRDTTAQASPPPLYLPPPLPDPPSPQYNLPEAYRPQTSASPSPSTFVQAAPVQQAAQGYRAPLAAPQTQPVTPRATGGAAVVVDTSESTRNQITGQTGNPGNSLAAPTSTDRARAGFLANRSTTVVQGTLIPAILETAFDSTRPGFARALVQRDIRGFDGTQILIPRGSRLIGEYAADTAQGQNRAAIAWSRLIRPDGVTIAIGSPVADPVGRGGVRADVNNHFFARFAGAILQSTLDIGVNLASRNSGSPTIVALPGSVQSGNLIQNPANIRPTLRVAAGTSVSVFVARDLDFTDTDAGR